MAGPTVASLTSASLDFIQARREMLAYYSPYFFLSYLDSGRQQELFGAGAAQRFGRGVGEEVLAVGAVQWLLSQLAWDTSYFGTPTYKLFTGLFAKSASVHSVQAAANALRSALASRGAFYAYSVVPAEDIVLLQGLTGAGWALIETRLTFFRDTIKGFQAPRYPVRLAEPADAERVEQIAATARNPYDRFHADPWFGAQRADAFLGRYAAAAVAGTYAADAVLVPDSPSEPLDSFLAISDLNADAAALQTAMSRVLLTAVGPANRGWHLKLMSETLSRAHQLKQACVLMTTQATNQAVFRSCEKLGFKLGATAHVLACHQSSAA